MTFGLSYLKRALILSEVEGWARLALSFVFAQDEPLLCFNHLLEA